MEQEIEYEQFAEPQTTALQGEVDLSRVSDIPMELSVEIGRTQMTVGETLSLRAGAIVTLDRLAGEPVDLLVNGTPIARGEVVVVDEKFGLRVKEILDGADAAANGAQSELGLADGTLSAVADGAGLVAEPAAAGASVTDAAGAAMAAAAARTPGVIAGPVVAAQAQAATAGAPLVGAPNGVANAATATAGLAGATGGLAGAAGAISGATGAAGATGAGAAIAGTGASGGGVAGSGATL